MHTYNKYKAYLPDGSTKVVRKRKGTVITGAYAYFYKGKWEATLLSQPYRAPKLTDEAHLELEVSFYNAIHNKSPEHPAQAIKFELITSPK